MRCGAILMLLLSLLLTPGGSRAQDAQPSEYQVKAALVFAFAKFVEWPPAAFEDAQSPFFIGVLGENPFGSDLEQFVRDKTLHNHAITIKECRTLEEAKKCHVLFISTSEKKRLPEVIEGLGGTPVLTVGETENFVKSGGAINFFREGNKFRFEINDTAARKAGLKIDSKLLGLGKKPAA